MKTKDHFHSKEEFSLLWNEDFDMLKTDPIPQDLEKYYANENYISHSDQASTFFAKIYQWVKQRSLKRKVGLIEKYSTGTKRILDIGSGTGEFLIHAKNSGWEVEGVEPVRKAREISLLKDINVQERIEDVKGKFDVITLWHVLEHIPDLDSQLKKIQELLKKDGILIIAVPNFRSYDAKFYGSYWAAYDVPRHIWHFSQKAMHRILRPEFSLLKTLPLYFDSFYVSLLSEKYKKKGFPIRAFFIGLLSNLKASKTREFSSLIYIFKKTNFKAF